MIGHSCVVGFPCPVFVSSVHCYLVMCSCTLGGLGGAGMGRSIVLLFVPSGTKACILSILKCCDLVSFPPSQQLERHKLYRLNTARIETLLFSLL